MKNKIVTRSCGTEVKLRMQGKEKKLLYFKLFAEIELYKQLHSFLQWDHPK